MLPFAFALLQVLCQYRFYRADNAYLMLQRQLSLHWIVQVQVQVTLRLTVSQSVSLGVEPRLGRMTRYLLLMNITVLFFVGHPL
jgi:hypothetical protein